MMPLMVVRLVPFQNTAVCSTSVGTHGAGMDSTPVRSVHETVRPYVPYDTPAGAAGAVMTMPSEMDTADTCVQCLANVYQNDGVSDIGICRMVLSCKGVAELDAIHQNVSVERSLSVSCSPTHTTTPCVSVGHTASTRRHTGPLVVIAPPNVDAP